MINVGDGLGRARKGARTNLFSDAAFGYFTTVFFLVGTRSMVDPLNYCYRSPWTQSIASNIIDSAGVVTVLKATHSHALSLDSTMRTT